MSTMLSTRYLLLALLAVMTGCIVGEMTCYDSGVGWYFPRDVDKCWSPDINGIFGGKLDGCAGGVVSIRNIGLCSCGCPVQSPCIAD